MATLDSLSGLQTEQINANSWEIDKISTFELCRVVNQEDATVAQAVSRCIPVIAAAIDSLAARVRAGGRVIYVGAGTSGRQATDYHSSTRISGTDNVSHPGSVF